MESESEESQRFHFFRFRLRLRCLRSSENYDCRRWKQKQKNQPITGPGIKQCDWSILPLLLATPTMQFSLDRKRRSHKRNRCSASDSVGLISTRSHGSTLQITTPTTTPSLVKTSLKAPSKLLSSSGIRGGKLRNNYWIRFLGYPEWSRSRMGLSTETEGFGW